ncbi:MAG: ABC transporter substrate-binding protein [Syntrophobacteraceae bacterium]
MRSGFSVGNAVLMLSALLLVLAPVGACAQEPVKIGAFFALSGPASSIGEPTRLVAQMVVDKINKEGGVGGRRIKLETGNTESDPTRALMEAKRLVEEGKVVALIGPTRTDEGMAVKPYIETSAHVPIVMTIGGDPVIAGGKFGPFTWTFKTPQRTSVAVKKLYEYIQSQNQKKIALLTASDGFGKDGLASLDQLAGQFGLEIVARESFAATDTDMTPQLLKIKASGAQGVICWTIGPAGARVAKNVKQLGIAIPLYQCHGQPDPKYVELAGEAANGTIMPSTKVMVVDQLPESDPQKKVISEFIRLYKDEYKFDKQYPVNTHSGYAWDAIYMVANAIKQGGAQPDKLRDALEQTKNYIGVSGIYTLTPEDHNGLQTDSMVMVKVENGKWVLLK